MSTLHSLAPTTKSEPRWLYRDIIPLGELVLLDGSPGVGKSLIATALVANLSQYMDDKRPNALLFLTAPDQRDLLIEFLDRHQPDYTTLKGIDFDPATHATEGQSLIQPILTCLEAALKKHKPSLIVIDSLEELLDLGPKPEAQELTALLKSLRSLAQSHHCSILIPRRAGLHESRSYGPFTRLGTEAARFALTLHYHPNDPLVRILTTAKHHRGPIGEQTHVILRNNGQAALIYTDPHEHVRPAKSPQTWQPDPGHQLETQQIINNIEAIMEDTPILTSDLKKYITEEGFSARAFNLAISQAKLKVIQKGHDYYYTPNQNMLMRFFQKKHQQQQADDSTLITQDVTNPLETEAHTPSAKPCTLRQTG